MKRGSALLVVLGMLSFLVVSAVAFSAFMREARRPSSYLLRTSSSRLLVKAGLVEAMDAIETAIGDNAYPGIGGTEGANTWIGRVFYGGTASGNTVPTLTLEGLAYVPFPLINEVRYHSRRTPTAAWRSFNFDSGRYAYTAIDVSDYFDVNRVMAAPGGGRTSAADGRVTLAYLFENAAHTDWRTPPEEWDTFMDNFLDDSNGGSKVPLVSVADLNLAIYDQKPKNVRSPWCEFIEGGSNQLMPDGEEARVQSNMVFVTDSWYPTAAASDELDIANTANQPFYGLSIGNLTDYKNRGVDEIAMMSQNAFSKRFSSYLRLPEYVQLCDYLDVDSVPTSLALPTTERVPMVVGVSLAGANTLELSATRASRTVGNGGQNQGGSSYEVTTYTLMLTGEINPIVAAVYPFKHQRGSDDNAAFSIQLAATVTLVPKDSVGSVRLQAARSPAVFTKDAWSENKLSPTLAGYGGATDSKPVVAMCSAPVSLSPNRKPGSASECLREISFPSFQFNNLAFSSKMAKSQFDPTGSGDDCTLRVVEKVDPDAGTRTVVEVTKGFLPSNADLSGTFASQPADIADGEEFVPVVQVWVRILNSDGDTVDLMPACVADDARPSQLLGSLPKDIPAQAVRPVLRFCDESKSVSINKASLENLAKTPIEVGRSPQAYVADDPRFNYAPEDLFAVNGLSAKLGDTWLDKVSVPGATKDEKDIFMETSDAGYLQSKYELAFLLDITGFGSSMWGELEQYKGGGSAKDAMWSAYTPYKSYEAGDGYADYFNDKFKIVSGTGETAICPYTPDVNVMMGALANTPYDWWAASTNDATETKKTMLTDIKDALKYTFSEHSSDASARVKWSDMENLANNFFIPKFRGMGKDANGKPSWSDWGEKYDELGWDGALFNDLEADSDIRLDSVDRKFLYGFWRECFDVRQQLFLIFVRAEPMMMGGGSNIRPVLGARAVALVWRDPVKPANGGPHRMRVLFYRQLD